MKARLSRTISLKSYLVYAEIEIPEKREDIKEYLSKSLGKNGSFNQKIQDYLRQIGLLNKGNGLTSKGQKVLSTGKLASSEFGKFQIWSTRADDALAGGYLLAFKRRKANRDEVPKVQLENIREEEYLSYLIEKKGTRHEFITLKNFGKKEHADAKLVSTKTLLQLVWNFSTEKAGNRLELQGQLSNKDFTQKIDQAIDHPFPDLSLHELLCELPEWNFDEGRLRISVSRAKKDTLQSFMLNSKAFYVNSPKYGEFENGELQNVPVMPENKTAAQEWLKKLLHFEAEKGFLLAHVFEQFATQFRQQKALAFYRPQVPKLDDLLDENPAQNNKNAAFWNLAAPKDLNPFSKVKGKGAAVFHLIPNQQYSFTEIVAKLVPKENIRQLIVADRYVQNSIQQKSFEALVLAVRDLKGEIPVILTTLNERQYRPSLPKIKVIDFSKIGHQDHDRFLIFITETGKWVVWKASRSVNYLQFKTDDFTEVTKGIARESAMFVPGSDQLLTAPLKQAITSKIQ